MGGVGGGDALSGAESKPPSFSGGQNKPESLRRVQDIVGQEILFQELNVLDEPGLQELFKKVRTLKRISRGARGLNSPLVLPLLPGGVGHRSPGARPLEVPWPGVGPAVELGVVSGFQMRFFFLLGDAAWAGAGPLSMQSAGSSTDGPIY